MQKTITDDRIKVILKEVIIDFIHEKNEEFYEVIVSAFEDAGLYKAIEEGKKNNLVSEDKIDYILGGKK